MKNFHRIIDGYVHGRRIGVLVKLGMESDFTANLAEVTGFLRDVAIHIAASSPKDVDELLVQPYVKEPSTPVGALLSELSAEVHERLEITRFIRRDSDEEELHPDLPPRIPANIMRLGVAK